MKNQVLQYFHAYGKVCFTICAQRIYRDKVESLASISVFPEELLMNGDVATEMWAVGMALALPKHKDGGTRSRGRTIAKGRSMAVADYSSSYIQKLPQTQLTIDGGLMLGPVNGEFLMNTSELDKLINQLNSLEDGKEILDAAINLLIAGLENDPRTAHIDFKSLDEISNLTKDLKRVRKLAAAHDGSARLYRTYKNVFVHGKV